MHDRLEANMHHFLDENGAISEVLPKPARDAANFLGAIVLSVLSEPWKDYVDTDISCRSTYMQGACSGKIVGCLFRSTNTIMWECPACGSGGMISGWEGTLWDCQADQHSLDS